MVAGLLFSGFLKFCNTAISNDYSENVVLRRGTKVLLDGATVNINPGEKVGLVGRNGAGKSSLFAVLNGNLHEDGGDFSIPSQWRMAQVAQDMPETSQTATEFVVEGDTVLLAARREVAEAEAGEDYMHGACLYCVERRRRA